MESKCVAQTLLRQEERHCWKQFKPNNKSKLGLRRNGPSSTLGMFSISSDLILRKQNPLFVQCTTGFVVRQSGLAAHGTVRYCFTPTPLVFNLLLSS